MSFKVSQVNGMPFVKYPLGNNISLAHCNCKMFQGKFGPSLAIFLDLSSPKVKAELEAIERNLKKLVRKVKPRLEELLKTNYDEDDLSQLKLIKNGVVWAKCLKSFPAVQKDAFVTLRFHHIFFSECRISFSVEAL